MRHLWYLALLLSACAPGDTVAELLLHLDAGGSETSDADASLPPAPADNQPTVNAAREDAGGRAHMDAGESDARAAAEAGTGLGPDAGFCLSELAARTFTSALCTCTDLSIPFGGLTTDSFDSEAGDYDAGTALHSRANVGANGVLAAIQASDVGGNLAVGGAFSVVSAFAVRGDLRVLGTLSYTSWIDVGGDLSLGGDLNGTATLHIGGDLIQAPGKTRTALPAPGVGGSERNAPVDSAPPCPCAPEQLLDVGAIVAAGKLNNDNESSGFKADDLTLAVLDARIELPAGRLYVPSIGGSGGTVRVVVNNRSVLFVGEDISIAGKLLFDLGPEGELDLFVGGSISISDVDAPHTFTRPNRLRVYMGGNYFYAKAFQRANVYAPNALGWTVDGDDLFGSRFFNETAALDQLHIHYDSSVLRPGTNCNWLDLSAPP